MDDRYRPSLGARAEQEAAFDFQQEKAGRAETVRVGRLASPHPCGLQGADFALVFFLLGLHPLALLIKQRESV
jgi:hypothetical protein